MTREDVLERIRAHLSEELEVDPSRIQEETRFNEDLEADSYERLAFLGDVVLSLAISTHLYPRFEDFGAGRLTKLRAQAVSRQACAEVARDLGVPERLRAAAPEGMGRSADALIASDRVL